MTDSAEITDVYNVRTDSESTGPTGRYLVWQYNGGRLEVDPCDSLQNALEAARMWDNSEYGSFDCIEGPAGIVLDPAVRAWIDVRDREDATAREAEAGERTTLFRVLLRRPDSNEAAEWDSCKTEEEARESAAELDMPDRVRIDVLDYVCSTAGLYHPENRRVIKDWND